MLDPLRDLKAHALDRGWREIGRRERTRLGHGVVVLGMGRVVQLRGVGALRAREVVVRSRGGDAERTRGGVRRVMGWLGWLPVVYCWRLECLGVGACVFWQIGVHGSGTRWIGPSVRGGRGGGGSK